LEEGSKDLGFGFSGGLQARLAGLVQIAADEPATLEIGC
jgi:hypothetical protein